MFDCGYKSQYIVTAPSATEMKRCKFNLDGLPLPFTGRSKKNASKSFRYGVKKGSDGLLTFGRSLRSGVTRAVFPEDLKVSDKTIFDPQDKSLLLWNRLFVISCILAVSIDPFFFYLPVFNHKSFCLGMDTKLAVTTTTLRTVVDIFFLIRMALQFRTAFIAPSSRVFGRGELVIDPHQIAMRYLQRYFIVDFLSVLPFPQIVVWKFLQRSKGSDVLTTKQMLLCIVCLQLLPRFFRLIPLTSDLKKTAGAFAESAWAGAAYYLLWFMLSGQVTGAIWYLLAVERNDTCWREACHRSGKCKIDFLYCGNKHMEGYSDWQSISEQVLNTHCSVAPDSPSQFKYGIYTQAIASGIVESRNFFSKFCYCIAGLILFALLIGNIQTYLQSITIRLEEMRIKRRDSEQWMHHRLLPQELREKVRRYNQYKWLETRGVDEESIRLLDAICERLKPSLYTESTYVVREGDPVNEMLFIIRGRLESVTTDGGRSGFFNRGLLKEGDFCGEELLTWALDPKAGSNLPSSTRTVNAMTEVEAFALEAEELKFVATQFRRLHSRQVQHTFRFYSQQWRTWAAIFIQAAWRRYARRKMAERRRKEEEEEEYGYSEEDDERTLGNRSNSSSRLRATILASRFAANALRGRRLRSESNRGLVNLQKPPEPDFSACDAD
ncbi:hypothetical protein G4B88_004010 [Cannabis sativa]|uniref:Cyclic nucleotide-binding domain-containing protein n=1 Tax=Cannabis sativa TaxID=3483 RepID=A0A7J6GXL9_CANSA|nr:hypothetical protein G4B88_004010 [Cannabis sativa]